MIVFYFLAITEKLSNLGILSWLYSTIGKTNVFYLLIIVGTAFMITLVVDSIRKPKINVRVSFGRRRPLTLDAYRYTVGHDFGVKWHLYPPELLSMNNQPWADGPYCPKCDRELEEETKGHIFKSEVWKCPLCGREYPKPKGDVKEMAEKNFAAYLRKKGEL